MQARLYWFSSDSAVTHEEVGAVQRAGAASGFDIVHELVHLPNAHTQALEFFKMCGCVDMAGNSDGK